MVTDGAGLAHWLGLTPHHLPLVSPLQVGVPGQAKSADWKGGAGCMSGDCEGDRQAVGMGYVIRECAD